MTLEVESENLTRDVIQRLLNDYQKTFPLVSRPFAQIARELKTSEEKVLKAYQQLSEQGLISRIGAVVKPHTVGVSTLAALKVPEDQIKTVVQIVNSIPEVNHNYLRTHPVNLWFVITAPSEERLGEILEEISSQSGLEILDLRLLKEFRIDLGFDLERAEHG